MRCECYGKVSILAGLAAQPQRFAAKVADGELDLVRRVGQRRFLEIGDQCRAEL